jgi:four helix bundle protein
MKTFKEAIVWQKGYQLTLFVYRITGKFPRSEEFALKTQLRRAGVSLISNFAEGFKKTSPKERIYFYKIAEGSLEEIKCQVMLSRDLGYLSLEEYRQIEALSDEVGRLLFRWIRTQK